MSEHFHNIPELSVSDLSNALKRVVEGAFQQVRVRGEISGFKRAASGHLYFNLKDADALINAVCWRGVSSRFTFQPEDGMEVICTGRISTFPGRSAYQIVVDFMEPAGEGALMALLEKRKKLLAAEGLFDAARKRPLPRFPQVIGVVTSPTGAVIRDILHRIAERWPVRVLVWPVLVQGEGAASQVANAIAGFNALDDNSALPRPDVLIVARGGGSLEDLWAFNEEVVVRAAASSAIPLISAVGHETDTTLIDYASDMRAPTPTAAAEMAVPVRAEYSAGLADIRRRMLQQLTRMLDGERKHFMQLARALPHPRRLVETLAQRLDDRSERLRAQLPLVVSRRADRLKLTERGLTPALMLRMLDTRTEQLAFRAERLRTALPQMTERFATRLARIAPRLHVRALRQLWQQKHERLASRGELPSATVLAQLGRRQEHVASLFRLLDNFHYRKVLARGFVLVRDAAGEVVMQADRLAAGVAVSLEWRDGTRQAVIDGVDQPAPLTAPAAPIPATRPKKTPSTPPEQGSLL